MDIYHAYQALSNALDPALDPIIKGTTSLLSDGAVYHWSCIV